MKKPKRKNYHCKVCGKPWESRKTSGKPKRCPNQVCQSVYWEKGIK